MSTRNLLYDWLRVVELGRFYPKFKSEGFDETSIRNLSPDDYKTVGVVLAADRANLDRLINILATEGEAGVQRLIDERAAASSTPIKAAGARVSYSQQHRSKQKDDDEPDPSPPPAPASSSSSASSSAHSGGGGGGGLPPTSASKGSKSTPSSSSAVGRTPAGSSSSSSSSSSSALGGAAAKDKARNRLSVGGGGASGPSSNSSVSVGGGGGKASAASNSSVSTPSPPAGGGPSFEAPGVGAYVAIEGGGKERIKVCVRKRPMSSHELEEDSDIVVATSNNTLVVEEPKVRVTMERYTLTHEYIFDEVFHEQCSNEEVYIRAARPLVYSIFNNGKGTCFAYGQTGSGKTFTMMGAPGNEGLYILAARDIYSKLADYPGHTIWISFFEIYSGALYDLLGDRKKIVAREDAKQRVVVMGLEEFECNSEEAFLSLMGSGNTIRSTAATGANADSSRSHAILQIVLKNAEGSPTGKLSFIDLAGSERAADTLDTDRTRRIEGAEINKSLLALKECIRALDQEKAHKPFRQSKLTQVLKDSFMGKTSKTVMIANISPNSLCSEHTLNTLRYADRVKELRRQGGGVGPVSHNADEEYFVAPPRPQPAREPVSSGNKGPPSSSSSSGAAAGNAKSRGGGGGGGEESSSVRRGSKVGQPPKEQPLPDGNVEQLVENHAELVSTILAQKEAIIMEHRQQIDEMMELVKQEMKLLHTVDQPGSAVDDYVASLDALLSRKTQTIQALRASLHTFQSHLMQEERLSKSLEASLPRPKKKTAK